MSDTGTPVMARPSFLRHLLAEAARDDHQATEALFCTFGINLGFFESQVLGPARATGAAVTTLSDAHVFPVDVRTMRAAGISYVPAVAAIEGAFHPKVNVIAGPQRAVVSIGSGNLTMDGWHNNDELCAVFTADRETGCPAIILELAQWLEGLPEAIHAVTPAGRDALHRVAGVLHDLASTAARLETDHRLVHSSSAPILEQLPTGPVDNLALYAPFHDQSGQALAHLITRFQPRSIDLALQTDVPYQTVIHPAALADAAEQAGVDLRFHRADGQRYRHGKLIQATHSDGHIWTLTGSANLSAAALLKSIEKGGNCEVGVVTTRHSEPLFPRVGAVPVPANALQQVTLFAPGHAKTAREPVTLLSAEIAEGMIIVHLAKPAPFPVTVEISRYKDQPDERNWLGVIPAGDPSATFEGEFPGGSRVRLSWQTSDGVTAVSGSERPLIDRRQAHQRTTTVRSNPHSPSEPSEFFDDPKAAAAWLDAVQTMTVRRATAPPSVPIRASKPSAGSPSLSAEDGWRTLDDPDRWQEYTDEAITRLGQTMVRFAFGGLPRMAALTETRPSGGTPDWADRPTTEDPTAEEGATIEEVTDSEPEADLDTTSAIAERLGQHRSAAERKRVRVWLSTVVETMAQVPAIDRLAMHHIVLIGTRGRFWESTVGEGGWFNLLATATVRLDGDDIPTPLQSRVAALIATSAYLLDGCLEPGLNTSEARTYQAVLREVGYRLLDLDDDALVSALTGLTSPTGFPLEPLAVREHADLITEPDPQKQLAADAERAIEDLDSMTAAGPLTWRATGPFTNPARVAAKILDLAPAQEILAVHAVGRREHWAVLLRHGQRLTWIDRPAHFTRYRDYILSARLTPSALATNADTENNHRIRVRKITVPSGTAAQALQACGITITDEGPVISTHVDVRPQLEAHTDAP